MLKQQQYRPLSSEIQVIVLWNAIKERITAAKQLRFYEYQVVPGLFYGLKKLPHLHSNSGVKGFALNPTTLSLLFLSVTEGLATTSNSKKLIEAQKEILEREMLLNYDPLFIYVNLLVPNASFLST